MMFGSASGRYQGVQFEEADFGFREEGDGGRVVLRFEGLRELSQGILELLLSHGR